MFLHSNQHVIFALYYTYMTRRTSTRIKNSFVFSKRSLLKNHEYDSS